VADNRKRNTEKQVEQKRRLVLASMVNDAEGNVLPLIERKGYSVREISDMTGLPISQVHSTLRPLIESGHIEKTKVPGTRLVKKNFIHKAIKSSYSMIDDDGEIIPLVPNRIFNPFRVNHPIRHQQGAQA
jgi:predicted transcriptional regulator